MNRFRIAKGRCPDRLGRSQREVLCKSVRLCEVFALLLLIGASLRAVAEQQAVPRTLGKGTGGDGAWSCNSAAHSPTTIKIDETAGPEGTPAAVLEFVFSKDKYNWNWAIVSLDSVDSTRFKALRFTYRTDVPAGFLNMNIMVTESSGGGYWAPQALPRSPGRFTTQTVPFNRFTLAPWSKDANGKLDLNLVKDVSIGLETGLSGKGRVFISDVELVPEGW